MAPSLLCRKGLDGRPCLDIFLDLSNFYHSFISSNLSCVFLISYVFFLLYRLPHSPSLLTHAHRWSRAKIQTRKIYLDGSGVADSIWTLLKNLGFQSQECQKISRRKKPKYLDGSGIDNSIWTLLRSFSLTKIKCMKLA